MRENWSPSKFKDFHNAEHDACGIVSIIEKRKVPTKENIDLCIDALVTMNHRAGFINGEGDGVGIHIDIPRALWKEKLENAGLDPALAERGDFIVGHLFLSKNENPDTLKKEIRQLLSDKNFELLFESDKVTTSSALGPIAYKKNLSFGNLP